MVGTTRIPETQPFIAVKVSGLKESTYYRRASLLAHAVSGNCGFDLGEAMTPRGTTRTRPIWPGGIRRAVTNTDLKITG